MVPAGAVLVEPEGFSPPNGIIDPGETDTLRFAFRNSGGALVTNLVATLLATNGVTVPSGPQSYGSLVASGPSVSRPFTFTAVGTNGQQIAATFRLQDVVTNTTTTTTNSLGTNSFTFYLGTWQTMISNTAPIIINAEGASSSTPAEASPYPSLVNVSGLQGVILKTTITLTNLTHTRPGAIEALLVAPNQQNTLLMNSAGAGNSVKSVTLTFDDAASTYLPSPTNSTPITTSTNKPTSWTTPNLFP